MRVLVIVKASKNSEAGVMPDHKLLMDMLAFNEALVNAGVMVSGDGLHPSSKGVRVHFTDAGQTVIPGPFGNTQELVGGFWIWEVASMEDALAWARRCPHPMPGEEAVLELRPIIMAEDFGEAMTPELKAAEDRLRAETEARLKG